MARIILPAIRGKNYPTDELNDTRAYGGKLFSVFLLACSVEAFGWFAWELFK